MNAITVSKGVGNWYESWGFKTQWIAKLRFDGSSFEFKGLRKGRHRQRHSKTLRIEWRATADLPTALPSELLKYIKPAIAKLMDEFETKTAAATERKIRKAERVKNNAMKAEAKRNQLSLF